MPNDVLKRIKRTHFLIKRKATGTPAQLAVRLGVSLRTVHRTIDILREMGAKVEYDKYRCSYWYREEVKLTDLLDIRD